MPVKLSTKMAATLKFKANSPGARLLVEQLRDFPNGDHDDGPDGAEMAVRLAGDLLAYEQSRQYETVEGIGLG
jgi:hypothetical protein